MSKCRSCEQSIDWVRTVSGKNMPVDPDYIQHDEVKPGTVLVTDGGNVITVKAGDRRPNIKGRISHFATCPEANQWRGGDKTR